MFCNVDISIINRILATSLRFAIAAEEEVAIVLLLLLLLEVLGLVEGIAVQVYCETAVAVAIAVYGIGK